MHVNAHALRQDRGGEVEVVGVVVVVVVGGEGGVSWSSVYRKDIKSHAA